MVLGIQRGGGLVHQQDGRVFDQRTGNGNALAFATRQLRAALAHRAVHATRQALRNAVHACLLGGFPHLGIAGTGPANADVVGHAAGKQIAVLKNLADLCRQLRLVHLPHIGAADQHGSLVYIPKARHQPHQGAFARARSPHQGRHAARRHMQVDPTQHGRAACGIGEMHIAQADRCIARRLRQLRLRQGLLRKKGIHGLQLALCAAQRIGVTHHLQQRLDKAADQQHGQHGAHHLCRCQRQARLLVQADGDGDQQGRKHGLHRPDIEHGRQRGHRNQAPGRLALLVNRLRYPAGALAFFALKGAQHRLGLRKLHHALAGLGKIALKGGVRPAAHAARQHQHAQQQRQGQQAHQAQAPILRK